MTNTPLVIELTILVLAIFLGFEVISKVPTMLHTPLMSGTNFIHGIVIVGAIVVLGFADDGTTKAIGFVAEIVEPDKIEARVYEMADTIASHAPLTIYATKEMIRRVQEQRRATGGEDIIELVYGSEDFREGVRAFLEKRKPNWKNR